ncbi:MAG: 50S ribosomal protein L9 [Candidatus Omnitrophota bacterium]
MEVILCQDIQLLGKTGDIIKVKDGYARNYLLPRKMAFLTTSENLRKIEKEKAKKLAFEEKAKKDAQELAEKLSSASCTVAVEVNDLEKLYGSITEVDIAKALETEGFSIDKKFITLEKPIEELGIYEAAVKLHPSIEAKVRVWVTKK